MTNRPHLVLGVLGGLAALVIMAFIVNVRLGGKGMPMLDENTNMAGKTGTLSQLAKLTVGESTTGSSGLPVLSDHMPEFAGIEAWLNSGPLSQADLRGKVVLIDFWTYSCINCIRTLPYITAWDRTYRDEGLLIVGVHTPEFAFEKEEKNVRAAIARHGIEYPVALDNAYATWNNYDNRYWPAKYLFDAQGRLRYFHFGEGKYDVTERNIQLLLEEAGMAAADGVTAVEAPSPEFPLIGTPETYIGYLREELLASPERVARDAERLYTVPDPLPFNRFALGGEWRIEGERAVVTGEDGGSIVIHYRASTANLVMAPTNGAATAEVLLDGEPVPANLRGADVFEDGGRTYVTIGDDRLYELVDGRGAYAEHLLELRFEGPGIGCYAYTFG